MLEYVLKLETIEASFTVPLKLHSSLNALQAVDNSQWEVIWAHTSISERPQTVQVRGSKCILNLLYRPVLTDDEVRPHQKNSIALSLEIRIAVVDHTVVIC